MVNVPGPGIVTVDVRKIIASIEKIHATINLVCVILLLTNQQSAHSNIGFLFS